MVVVVVVVVIVVVAKVVVVVVVVVVVDVDLVGLVDLIVVPKRDSRRKQAQECIY